MIAVALRQLTVDNSNLFPIDRGGVAMIFAPAVRKRLVIFVYTKDLGIFLREPGGTRTAWSGKNDPAAVLINVVDGFVKEGKIKFSLFRLKRYPREDSNRHCVAMCKLHQAHILVQDVGMVEPLLGIVVSAVQNVREGVVYIELFHRNAPLFLCYGYYSIENPHMQVLFRRNERCRKKV